MKIILSAVFIFLHFQFVFAQCNSGPYTVSANTTINGSCIITGDLTIVNGATLNVDFTAAKADTFIVRGTIFLQGNAVLWVHASVGSTNDQFIVSNSFSNQRSIVAKDSSRVQLENIEFRTQEGDLSNAASIYMTYSAQGKSMLYVNNSFLNSQTAWLLCNMNSKSTFIGYNSNHLPTEVYLQDTAQVVLHGPKTVIGMWFNLVSTTGTLNLPPDQSQPYSWKIGRGNGGLNTTWYFETDTAKAGLGVEILPNTKVTINGTGSSVKEVTVALYFANATDTLSNLKTGVQDTTVSTGINGRVTLNNVNLGPIAWQVYALMNENLYIKNSVINEIGIAGPSQVKVDSCLLQLAVLAAVGTGGSTMTVNNCEVWNQAITASNNGHIIMNNCNVTGSAFSTTDALSDIKVNGGCFFKNPLGCTMNTALNMATGQPYCNPFIPAGYPQNLSPTHVTFTGVNSNCALQVNNNNVPDVQTVIFPNPFYSETTIRMNTVLKNAILTLYNSLGEKVNQAKISGQTVTLQRNNLPAGIYFFCIEQNNQTISSSKLIIAD